MISGEQIGQLILKPTSVKKAELDEIQELVDKYPYCSSLYIIQLVGLSKANDINFESKLKIAASHVSDREHLHQLVIEGEGTEIAEDEEVEEIKVVAEAAVIEEIIIETEEKPQEENVEEEEELSELEESIMSHVVESAFTVVEDEQKVLDEDIEEAEVAKDASEEIALSPIEFETAEVIAPEIVELKRPKNMSFIEWLKYKQAVVSNLEEKDSTSKEGKSMSKKQINELLDKFIEEEPSMPAVNRDINDSTTGAKKSVEESFDNISETLAEIHVMQGNYSKAISAYKQLSLLYPEKKVFFASQIKKIKDKQS